MVTYRISMFMWLEILDGCHGRSNLTLGNMENICFILLSYHWTIWQQTLLKYTLDGNLTKVCFCDHWTLILKSKLPNVWFFSESIKLIEHNLLINNHWMVTYKVLNFLHGLEIQIGRHRDRRLWCIMPLLTIFQLYRGCQFNLWKKPGYLEKTTDMTQIID